MALPPDSSSPMGSRGRRAAAVGGSIPAPRGPGVRTGGPAPRMGPRPMGGGPRPMPMGGGPRPAPMGGGPRPAPGNTGVVPPTMGGRPGRGAASLSEGGRAKKQPSARPNKTSRKK